ncbi:MAG TPA: caspase family protein [Pirellulales bacterium]|nr:caspase family protein [Pirellulales bacterium]
MMKIGFVVLFTVVSCAAAHGEGHALVIGVNDCPDFELPDGGLPRPLRGAEADADAVANALVEQFGFQEVNVELLKGTDATLASIRGAMKRAAERTRSTDQFVFHFSGHGTQLADRRPYDERDDLDEALCPHDATADGEHLLVDDELGRWLDDLRAGQVTVILDCCHAGSGTKEPDDDVAPRYLPGRVRANRPDAQDEPWRDLRGATKALGRRTAAFFACGADQRAYERRMPGQRAPARAGQFSHYLLEGLRDDRADANRDGVVSNQEALDYASKRLNATFNRDRPLAADRQEPVLEADSADSPLFGVKR